MNLIALLNNTDFLGPLSVKSKECIADLAAPKELKKNHTLFVEGEKGSALYLLASGNVQLSKANAGGDKNVIIKSVKPGEIFAEVILFEEDRYPVTAIALKDSLVFIFPKKQFIALLEIVDFRNEFIMMLLRKQRYLTERMRSLVTMDVSDKLFHFLKQHYGARERIVPGISKKDLAAAIDVTPETLSRLLLRLKADGILSWEAKEIVFAKGFWNSYNK
jgi:CRP/FNR family cyclic AMP-dependent transcriptional regulator